jgi:hypothetical protein
MHASKTNKGANWSNLSFANGPSGRVVSLSRSVVQRHFCLQFPVEDSEMGCVLRSPLRIDVVPS